MTFTPCPPPPQPEKQSGGYRCWFLWDQSCSGVCLLKPQPFSPRTCPDQEQGRMEDWSRRQTRQARQYSDVSCAATEAAASNQKQDLAINSSLSSFPQSGPTGKCKFWEVQFRTVIRNCSAKASCALPSLISTAQIRLGCPRFSRVRLEGDRSSGWGEPDPGRHWSQQSAWCCRWSFYTSCYLDFIRWNCFSKAYFYGLLEQTCCQSLLNLVHLKSRREMLQT